MGLTKKDIKWKNLKRLLKAIAEIKHLDVRLKIAGKGGYEWKVRHWTKKLNIQDKVELLGYINNTEIDNYHASAAAFVLPSKAESFGMVYAEALFNGTPILCSKGVVGFEGFFKNVGVAVDPYSVNDIREGIIELITNNSFYRNEIKKLRNSGAFGIFDPVNISNIYKRVLLDVVPVEIKRSAMAASIPG
jgi:glycosyltransferase involved in cell wall biosynthesis